MIALPQFVKQFLTHAEIRNARFNQNTSVFVSVKQRIDDYCQAVSTAGDMLKNTIKDFKTAHPNLKWDNIKLVKSHNVPLKDICIDDTMNRPLNWAHVLKILKNFSNTRVLAINVYEDPLAPGKYIAWDGQHTSIVLYIISILICEEAMSKIMVPVCITPSSSKLDIRDNFIALNTDEGKLPLGHLDLFEQKVYSVLVDGSTEPNRVEAANKHKLLAAVDIFMTSKEYGDVNKPGALTAIEFIDKSPLSLVEQFCTYWRFRKAKEDRYIESKELIMICSLLTSAKTLGWTTTEIEAVVDIFWDTFQCEFTGEKYMNVFWKKLNTSYIEWFKNRYHPGKTYESLSDKKKSLIPKRLKMAHNGDHQVTYGTVFLIEQLRKAGFTGVLPNYDHDDNFMPDPALLW